jgi:hypothetical protein
MTALCESAIDWSHQSLVIVISVATNPYQASMVRNELLTAVVADVVVAVADVARSGSDTRSSARHGALTGLVVVVYTV